MTEPLTNNQLQLVACPRPFSDAQIVRQVDAGGTLSEILDANGMADVVSGHWLDARVEVGGVLVPVEYWQRVRPKGGVLVTVRVCPAGGEGGNKDIMRAVLMIGVMAAAMTIPGMQVFAAGAALAGWGAVAGAAVGIMGALAVNALIPPPSDGGNNNSFVGVSRANSITGTRNQANPYGVVPQVFGRHLIYPTYAAEPYTEYVGDQQYIRLLFLIGYGYYDLTDHKIGNTAIASYEEVQTAVYTPSSPLTVGNGLYPADVSTSALSIELLQNEAHTETTGTDCDEFSLDIYWPTGLFYLTNDGEPRSLNNSFTISYSVHGENSWTDLSSTSLSWKKTEPFSKTYGTAVTRGQYDIRVTRLTEDGDSESNKHYDTTYWTALRTIKHTSVTPLTNCTYVAMRIRATGQLNGVVDQYNVVAFRKLQTYNTGTGTWSALTATRNPAWHYCEVLRAAPNKMAVADARLDLTTLAAWAARMDAASWYVDLVVDAETTPFKLCQKIAASGKASWAMRDMKFSVVEDIAQTVPRQHITPSNSWGFVASRVFTEIPHCIKARFKSEDVEGYAEDELLIYADGYTSANATVFETLQVDGITDPDLVWKVGRYHLAQATLRPWVYKCWMDVENLVATRGDLVRHQHDSILTGLGSGRITTVTLDGSSRATAITIDNAVTMAAGTSYTVCIRRSTGAEISQTVTTVAGEVSSLTFSTPIAAASVPAVGDLYMFGVTDSVYLDMIITNVRPSSDLTTEISMVDAAPAIHTADTGTIPDYDPGITIPPEANRIGPPVPSIVSLATQYNLNEVNGPTGQLQVVVYFKVAQPALAQPSVYLFHAEYSYTPDSGEDQSPWKRIATIPADLREAHFPAELGTEYDFRIRSVAANGSTSAWATYDDYTASVTSWVGVNVTGLQVRGGGTTFTGRDCHIEWDATTHVRAAGYRIVVSDTSTSTPLGDPIYLAGVNNNQWCYTYQMNMEDTGGGPVRALTFNVWVYDTFGTLSSSDPADLAELNASNPAPSMAGLTPTVTGMTRGLMIDWRSITPADNDLIGFSVFCSATQADVTNLAEGAVVATVDQYTRQHFAVGLEPEDTYYVRILPWDGFGSGVASSANSAEPLRLASEDVMAELVGSITITDSFGNEYNSAD